MTENPAESSDEAVRRGHDPEHGSDGYVTGEPASVELSHHPTLKDRPQQCERRPSQDPTDEQHDEVFGQNGQTSGRVDSAKGKARSAPAVAIC